MFLALSLAAALATTADAQVAPAAADVPVTLKQAIALANTNSPFRASAVAIVAGTADAARVAGRPLNPSFEFRTENWTPSTSTSLPLDLWAVVSQPIELGGKRGLRQAIAEAERDQAAAALSLVDRQLALRVTGLYFSALRTRATVATLAASRDGLSTLVDTMRRRLDEGYVAESDLLRFEAEAARLDIEVARARLDLARNIDTLSAAVGMPGRFSAEQLVIPDAISPPRAGGDAVAAAVERHPEVLTAYARMARAEQTIAFERARRLPDPAVIAGFKQTLGVGTVVAAVTTTIPLFDHNDLGRATALGELRTATAERDAIRIRLASETTTLVSTAQALAERSRRARRELLEPSEGVRTAARVAFEEGAVDVLKLIDAERVYADVTRVALDLQLEATSAAIEARIALGEEPMP